MIDLTVETALFWAAFLSSIAILLATAESWSIRSVYGPKGLLASGLLERVDVPRSRGRLRRLAHELLHAPSMPTLLVLQIMLAISLAAGYVVAMLVAQSTAGELAIWVVLLACVLTNLAIQARTPAGQDGADQMATIVLVACAVGLMPGAPLLVSKAAAWFIALQACLAYSTSGFAKLFSSEWRSGDAINLVFRTSSYGSSGIRRFLSRYPHASKVMATSVILFECMFPLAVLVGGRVLLMYLAGAILFHVSVLAMMRLNTFLFAFPATYGALIFVAR